MYLPRLFAKNLIDCFDLNLEFTCIRPDLDPYWFVELFEAVRNSVRHSNLIFFFMVLIVFMTKIHLI